MPGKAVLGGSVLVAFGPKPCCLLKHVVGGLRLAVGSKGGLYNSYIGRAGMLVGDGEKTEGCYRNREGLVEFWKF